ncbi:MAG: restriction endonuclease subunit S [Clostridium celatum]|nr:restriction endonuclease subunit S [Clostridium celatum]
MTVTYQRPKEWIIKKFYECIKIKEGQVDPKQEPYSSMFHIGPANIEKDTGRLLYVNTASEDHQTSGKYMFKSGDVLYGKINPQLSKVIIAEFEGICSADIYPLEADGVNIVGQYLKYILLTDDFYKYSVTVSKRTGMPKINREDLNQYKVLLPTLEEQKQIVEILSTWDLAIEKQVKLIEKKKEFKKGLMQRLLSGEVRFKEFTDKWSIEEIGYFIEEYKEKSTISNQYPVLTSSRNGIVLQKDYFKDNQVTTNDNIGYNIIPRDYITFRTRSDDGTFVFNQNKIIDMGIVSYFYPVFKFKEEINTYFAITWLNNCIDKQIRREIVGTSQLVLSLNKLKKFKINLPSIEEQNKIAEVLIEADKEIELLEKELEALKLQKKGLMQRLLTGEVRVKI